MLFNINSKLCRISFLCVSIVLLVLIISTKSVLAINISTTEPISNTILLIPAFHSLEAKTLELWPDAKIITSTSSITFNNSGYHLSISL